ncbi:dTMP kinase [Paenibacillus abyssi]|uniref:Thymidylate kinase n=1 Tax=Paenibacillus abyssi TaxID=1340531 RepID=A0A917G5V5_9BACL|nr:dTMP kinase [Paenibacillus abyssi]GGG24425.1 thymidylate kinase [Paenibacillus abyssi]
MKTGRFITIEGGEGAGKTTLIDGLAKRISKLGRSVLITREPGGIPIAEDIRGVILDAGNTNMDARTEALLYAAARRQHLVEKVIPALNKGEIVICDRFIDSSLAYQGYARGIGMDAIWEINRFAVEETMPDLTLWMDVRPETGLARINKASSREINRLDLEGLVFHQKVQDGYRILQQRYPERIIRIDAEQPSELVLEQVFMELDQRFKGFFATDVKL